MCQTAAKVHERQVRVALATEQQTVSAHARGSLMQTIPTRQVCSCQMSNFAVNEYRAKVGVNGENVPPPFLLLITWKRHRSTIRRKGLIYTEGMLYRAKSLSNHCPRSRRTKRAQNCVTNLEQWSADQLGDKRSQAGVCFGSEILELGTFELTALLLEYAICKICP